MTEPYQGDVAVFFDFENITYSLRQQFHQNPNFESLMDKCQEYGRVTIARAYADWSRQTTSIIPPLQASGFDPIYVPTYYYGSSEGNSSRKNAVDMQLAVEAMTVLHDQPNVSTFILLTGDRDFISVVNALRRRGKRVVALGVEGTASSHLAQAVDEFIFYSQLLETPQAKRKLDAYEALVQVVETLVKNDRPTVLPAVKHAMGELLGGFDEGDHKDAQGQPFRKFKDFILDAQRRGLVRLVATGTVNEVFPPTMSPPPSRQETQERPPAPAAEKERPKEKEKAKEQPASKAKEPEKAAAKPKAKQPAKAQPKPKPKEPEKEPAKPAAKEADPRPAPQPTLEGALDLLAKAVDMAREEGKSQRAASIKNLMTRLRPGFDEKKIQGEDGKAFARFTDFVRAAEAKGMVTVSGFGIATEVYPAGKQALAKLTPREARQLIAEALQTQEYPAPVSQVVQRCRQLRTQRRVYLPNPQIQQLLDEAESAGVLETFTPSPSAAPHYRLTTDKEAINAYLMGGK